MMCIVKYASTYVMLYLVIKSTRKLPNNQHHEEVSCCSD
jgi:hypothetical protein